MTKFTYTSIADFKTIEANVGRKTRNPAIVVICEADDGSWCELDAESPEHGKLLANNWVDPERGRGRGASVWDWDRASGAITQHRYLKFEAVGVDT